MFPLTYWLIFTVPLPLLVAFIQSLTINVSYGDDYFWEDLWAFFKIWFVVFQCIYWINGILLGICGGECG